MATRINRAAKARTAELAESNEAASGVFEDDESVSGSRKRKKSRWREIEAIRRKFQLLKALREINPDFDPYSSQEYMEF